MPHPDIARVLWTQADIRRRVRALGARISQDYAGREVLMLSVLRGSVIFLADLIRAIKAPCAIDFVAVASYNGVKRRRGSRVTLDLRRDPRGREVLIVEDIADTGHTLRHLIRTLRGRGVKSLKTCVLLDKPSGRRVKLVPDYRGFRVPAGFVVGYGLDYRERYRNLPYIGLLKRRVYEGKASDL